MNFYSFFGFVAISAALVAAETGKTTFTPRLLSQDSTYEIAMQDYVRNTRGGDRDFSFHATTIFMQSIRTRGLAEYVLFNHQTSVLVTEVGGAGVVYPNAIFSEWLGLNSNPETFLATFSLSPQRTVRGTIFNIYGRRDNTFVSFLTPVIIAQSDLHFHEHLLGTLGNDPSVKTVKEAFTQVCYNYGRMENASKVGIDDIKVKYGRLFCCPSFQGKSYVQLFIPTGSADRAQFVFDPCVGSRHWGLGLGVNFFRKTWSNEDRDVSLIADCNWVYRFKASELRSFDLKKNGPYSRYLLLAGQQAATSPISGIDLLTSSMEVFPGNAFEGLFACHGRQKKLNVEIGCDLFFRQRERVKLQHWPQAKIGIFDPGEIFPDGTTSSSSTIGTTWTQAAIEADPSFVQLTKGDADLSSAEQGSVFTNKWYLAIGRDFCTKCGTSELAVLGSYEQSFFNTGLSQWSLGLEYSTTF